MNKEVKDKVKQLLGDDYEAINDLKIILNTDVSLGPFEASILAQSSDIEYKSFSSGLSKISDMIGDRLDGDYVFDSETGQVYEQSFVDTIEEIDGDMTTVVLIDLKREYLGNLSDHI